MLEINAELKLCCCLEFLVYIKWHVLVTKKNHDEERTPMAYETKNRSVFFTSQIHAYIHRMHFKFFAYQIKACACKFLATSNDSHI